MLSGFYITLRGYYKVIPPHRRFPFIRGSGGAVNFEISFSAYCGVRNSALIRQYVLRYPAVCSRGGG